MGQKFINLTHNMGHFYVKMTHNAGQIMIRLTFKFVIKSPINRNFLVFVTNYHNDLSCLNHIAFSFSI
jgi:hypothetical protein